MSRNWILIVAGMLACGCAQKHQPMVHPEMAMVWVSPMGSDSDDDGAAGFLVTPDGYLVTCGHAVSGAKGVNVTIGDAKPVHGDVVNVDEDSDVAVVKIAGAALPWLEMYQGDVEVGMHLRAVRGSSMVEARFEEWENLGHDLGLAGNLSPWDCGTPLLADDGTVVGVVRGAVSTSGDRPVATPVWRVVKLMPQLPSAQKQAIEHPGER